MPIEQDEEKMIGVKRPLKLGAPKPPKSAKKKKLLKQAPIPDMDAQSVVPIRQLRENVPDEEVDAYLEHIQQRPSSLVLQNPYAEDPFDRASCGFVEQLPSYEVMEEGDVPSAEEMVKNISAQTKEVLPAELEHPETMSESMRLRYEQLLQKANPKELIKGRMPSLTWLESRYGQLVEKDFWYDRHVQLASTYTELRGDNEESALKINKEGLEHAVGHLVPYTKEEKEYLQLMENYRNSSLQIDGRPTLEFLRKHYTKPQNPREIVPPSSPEYLPDLSEDDEELVKEALNVGSRYVESYMCPIHEETEMHCLNSDEICGALFFKCSTKECPVFFTSNTHQDVCHQLREAIHPTVYERLFNTDLKCHCNFTPRMKLSQSEKKFGRVYLTCFKKQYPCSYFQWIHWKVREPQGPMDAYVQHTQPKYSLGLRDEAQRQNQALQRAIQAPHSQQLVRTGLDSFTKDDVKVYKQPIYTPWKTRELKKKPWGPEKSEFCTFSHL